MPTLLRFNGYVLRIYFTDHGVPHVHLIGADCDASIAIGTGEVIVGSVPGDALETAKCYIEENRKHLLSLWRS